MADSRGGVAGLVEAGHAMVYAHRDGGDLDRLVQEFVDRYTAASWPVRVAALARLAWWALAQRVAQPRRDRLD